MDKFNFGKKIWREDVENNAYTDPGANLSRFEGYNSLGRAA